MSRHCADCGSISVAHKCEVQEEEVVEWFECEECGGNEVQHFDEDHGKDR